MLPSQPVTTDSVAQATSWLQKGQLLAYPTESVWGIGCDPFNQTAVQQLLAIKQRPQAKGMIVVTDNAARITTLLECLSAKQRKAVLDSWYRVNQRQAYTWLLPIPESLAAPIPSWITGAHNSIAVRVIAHPLIQQLCAQMVSVTNPYGFIISTSCNPSNQPPARSLVEAQRYFLNRDCAEQVHYLKGETLGYRLPSQICNALTGQVIR